MKRFALLLSLIFLVLPATAIAQESGGEPLPQGEIEGLRESTGGATTLEDILRRQAGEEVPNDYRRVETGQAEGAAPITAPLGTLGGASDPDLWRAMRFGEAEITSQVRSPGATLIVQDTGMEWLQFREGPLREYGGYFLLGVLAFLALFFVIRGRIKIDHGRSGVRIQRFGGVERFGHWLLAVSFIILGITGLFSLFGRTTIRLFDDPERYESVRAFYAQFAGYSKWIHDNVGWAFMLGLVIVFFLWVLENIPRKVDLVWLAKGGGLLTGGHPHSYKFNAGQKIIFWAVILLGVSISVSGLSLLFPFELPLFAKTFAVLNSTGLPELVGYGTLPETLTPHAEMQLSQTWHAIIAFVFIGIIFAHIYIGTIGMEGAFDAMGKGDVDLNWAKEHHDLWVENLEEEGRVEPKDATPAE